MDKDTNSLGMAKMETKAKQYYATYEKHMDLLMNESTLSKIRPVDSYDVWALGQQFETFDMMKDMYEANGSISQLGPIPKIVYDVLTVEYGTQVLPHICNIQPIEDQKGVVYFMNLKSANTVTKGNVTPGEVLEDVQTGIVTPEAWAGNTVTNEIGAVVPTPSITPNFNFTCANIPLRGSMKITLQGSPAIYCIDNEDGTLIGAGVYGTIDYDNGDIVLHFAANPPQAMNIYATYNINYEAATDIPTVQAFLDSTLVEAQVYALKTTLGMLENFGFQRRFGISAEEMMSRNLISEVNIEVAGDVIKNLYANVQGSTTYDNAVSGSESYYEHKQNFKDAMAQAEEVIIGNAGRGMISTMIAGRKACGLIKTLPGFVLMADGQQFGAHVFGTLDGVTVVRVPETAVLPTNKVVCLHKGNTPFETAAVYAPFMPLTVTSLIPLAPNPLQQMRAAAVWAANKVLIKNFITQIEITHI